MTDTQWLRDQFRTEEPTPIAEVHPCAYTGEACEMCGCVDECMGIGVGYYDRRAIAAGELRRVGA